MKRKAIFWSLIFLTGVMAGLFITARLDLLSPAKSESIIPATIKSSYNMEEAVINVADTVGKAVVSISTERTTRLSGSRRYQFGYPRSPQSPFGGSDPFQDFFEDFFGQIPDREFKQSGLGSGVIIDEKGYILTNEHVINGADKITVTLADGREFKGEIKGRDERSDLAVIKIDAKKLPVAQLGDSDSLKIGQWVVAIGNPFGFAMDDPEPTVTVGVVSALHRSLGRVMSRQRDYGDVIQTDAAINPGNSGGPLVNLKGEVVGINVAIFSTSGGYQGIGFAIPVNNAKRIITGLIEGKRILYGWLGITVQDLTDDLAAHFGLTDKTGALVVKVLEEGPAAKAGITAADVIKQIGGVPVNSVRELLNVVGKAEVGKPVKVTVVRNNKEMALNVVIGERPQDLREDSMEPGTPQAADRWRGMQVEELTSESAQALRIDKQSGVLIVDIEPDSLADKAGLVVRDVIEEINKQPVKNIADYKKITAGLQGDALVKTVRGYFLVKEK